MTDGTHQRNMVIMVCNRCGREEPRYPTARKCLYCKGPLVRPDLAAVAKASEDREITTTYRTICDLRQPLTAILGRAQLATLRLRRGDFGQVKSDLRIIEEQAQRLTAMLRQLAGDGGE